MRKHIRWVRQNCQVEFPRPEQISAATADAPSPASANRISSLNLAGPYTGSLHETVLTLRRTCCFLPLTDGMHAQAPTTAQKHTAFATSRRPARGPPMLSKPASLQGSEGNVREPSVQHGGHLQIGVAQHAVIPLLLSLGH